MTVLNLECGGQTFQISMPDHHSSHEWNNGAPGNDMVNFHPRMFSMLRSVAEPSSVLVNVSVFYYVESNRFKIFGGGQVNLTAYIPTDPNRVKLVLIGLDTSTNQLSVSQGAEAFDSVSTPPPTPDVPDNFIPSALVRLTTNMTEISDIDITDARVFLLDPSGSGTGGDPTAPPNGKIHLLKNDGTVEVYDDFATAAAAASAEELLWVGKGSFTVDNVTLTSVNIRGMGIGQTYLSASTAATVLTFDGVSDIRDVSILSEVTNQNCTGIVVSSGFANVTATLVEVIATGTGTGASIYGVRTTGGATLSLRFCKLKASGGSSLNDALASLSSSDTVEIEGGTYDGTTFDIFMSGTATAVGILPKLVNGLHSGDIESWFVGSQGELSWIDNSDNAPLNITERSSPPAVPSTGDIYLDDGTNTASSTPGWRRYNGSAWEDIGATSGSGGVGLAEVWFYS